MSKVLRFRSSKNTKVILHLRDFYLVVVTHNIVQYRSSCEVAIPRSQHVLSVMTIHSFPVLRVRDFVS